MKIGLPVALMHHYYFPLWKTLFEELGCEVVTSSDTTGDLLEEGIKVSTSELCVPIKAFNAHVINLLGMGVDYCFIPRFVSFEKSEWYCPKFLGLPTIVEFSIPNIVDKILTIDIETKREDTCELKNYLPLCDKLNVSKKQLKDALKSASKKFADFRKILHQGYTIDEANKILAGETVDTAYKDSPVTIGVLGYVYNVYDKMISMDIISRLRAANINVITFEMLDDIHMYNKKKAKDKPLFWIFARKIYNARKYLTEHKKVDGLIHVTAFACGPDAVIGKMFEIESENENFPFMTIRIDEHSGESHIQTRLEAFCDMLKRKKGI